MSYRIRNSFNLCSKLQDYAYIYLYSGFWKITSLIEKYEGRKSLLSLKLAQWKKRRAQATQFDSVGTHGRILAGRQYEEYLPYAHGLSRQTIPLSPTSDDDEDDEDDVCNNSSN